MSSNSVAGFQVPSFDYAKAVSPLDTGKAQKGSIGLHNADTSAQSLKVTFKKKNGTADIDVTLRLNSGDYVLVEVDRVWTTGSPTNIVALYKYSKTSGLDGS